MWAYQPNLSAIQQYFSRTINQPIVLSAMTAIGRIDKREMNEWMVRIKWDTKNGWLGYISIPIPISVEPARSSCRAVPCRRPSGSYGPSFLADCGSTGFVHGLQPKTRSVDQFSCHAGSSSTMFFPCRAGPRPVKLKTVYFYQYFHKCCNTLFFYQYIN